MTPSLRALSPLAARPEAAVGSNPAVGLCACFWMAALLRASP